MQEKFRPLIYRMETVISKSSLICDSCNTLNIPIIVTEQYSKVFGKTVPELKINDASQVFEKTKFSMLTNEVHETIFNKFPERKNIILCGIEAHVCVMQSMLDLSKSGYSVYLPCDTISSQRPHDRVVALNRMKDAGAIVTTSESILFELLEDSKHPNFKIISGYIKQNNSKGSPNEFALDNTI